MENAWRKHAEGRSRRRGICSRPRALCYHIGDTESLSRRPSLGTSWGRVLRVMAIVVGQRARCATSLAVAIGGGGIYIIWEMGRASIERARDDARTQLVRQRARILIQHLCQSRNVNIQAHLWLFGEGRWPGQDLSGNSMSSGSRFLAHTNRACPLLR